MAVFLFIIGYATVIWTAFLVFVLCMLPGHLNPGIFSVMYLTLWPAIVIGIATEGFQMTTEKFRLLLNDSLLTKRLKYRRVYGWGLIGGVMTVIVIAVTLAVAFYTTFWLALLAVAVNAIMPGWLFEIRARRYYALHAGERAAA